MRALLRFLPLPCLLLALWVLLNDSLSIGTIALGAVMALVLSLLAPKLRPVRASLSSPLVALRLIGHVFTDIVRSNVAIACTTRSMIGCSSPKAARIMRR